MPFEFHLNTAARVASTLGSVTHLGVSPIHDVTVTLVKDFLSGTLAGQIDCAYARRRTVASGATDTIDINGVTNDVFNQNIVMATLVGFILINEDVADANGIVATPNTTNLTVGGGANAIANILGGAAATKIIRPGGIFISLEPSINGIGPVTAGTADIITVTNAAGASNSYQIILLGRTV